MLLILTYVLVGIIQDFVLTLNWRYIAENRPVASAISAFGSSFIGLIVLYNILTRLNSHRSILAILAYTVGISIGTYLALKSEKFINRLGSSRKTKRIP